jgi:hypothetical protein
MRSLRAGAGFAHFIRELIPLRRDTVLCYFTFMVKRKYVSFFNIF